MGRLWGVFDRKFAFWSEVVGVDCTFYGANIGLGMASVTMVERGVVTGWIMLVAGESCPSTWKLEARQEQPHPALLNETSVE